MAKEDTRIFLPPAQDTYHHPDVNGEVVRTRWETSTHYGSVAGRWLKYGGRNLGQGDHENLGLDTSEYFLDLDLE